ncbi:MAG: PQQ-binding-like beta-propeller repeat protein [bacterium]|nr:PQQ-binding-like beta-propeller repeat protein [bacterium]
MRVTPLVVLGVALAVACRPARDSGRWRTLGWNPEALAHGPAIRWEAYVGKGHSEAVVDGNRLCTMGNRRQGEGKDATFFDVVSCRDTATGEVIWETSYPIDDITFPGPRSTPAFDGDRLFTLSWAGHVHCFDARDGTVLWSRHLADEGLAQPGLWGLAGSPVIDGNLLILTAGRAGVAFDKTTGELVWAGEPAETSLPTPVVFDRGDRRLVALPHDETLYAVDVASGEVQWTFPRDGDFHVAPVLLDSKLVMPGHDSAVLLDVSGAEPRVLMEATGVGFSSYQHIAVFDGHAYSFSGDTLQCIDITSGRRKWEEELCDYGSLTIADALLIVLTGDGELVIAPASPDGFEEISRARVLTLQYYCWTRPVLANSTIYVRDTGGHLVAVDMSWRDR